MNLKQLFILLLLLLCCKSRANAQDYNFQDTMTKAQLELYLSRTIENYFDKMNMNNDTVADVVQMCADMNARLLIHTFSFWGGEYGTIVTGGLFDKIDSLVKAVDTAYAQAGLVRPIVGMGIYEIVTGEVDSIDMNDETAAAFNVTKRRFRYADMLYTNDSLWVNYWGNHVDTVTHDTTWYGSVPDISKPETRMYFYYLATEYIKRGIEHIDMGQIALEDENDKDINGVPTHDSTWALNEMIRAYAAGRNRGLVPLSGGPKYYIHNGDSTLLYDFYQSPLRPLGYDSLWPATSPYNNSTLHSGVNIGGPAKLAYTDCSYYGKNGGGRTHWGWYADTLPYLAYFDISITNDTINLQRTCFRAWNFDDASWWCNQNELYRNIWLKYAAMQIKCLDRHCFFAQAGRHYYDWTNTSQHYHYAMTGYDNSESTVKDIWDAQVADYLGNSEIDSNTTWSSGKYVYNDIHITAGHTLTINNTGSDTTVIRMPKDGRIIVDSGAQLIVEGARITNTCDECFWQGIVTHGHSDQAQNTTHQAKVVLNGATIEHAKAGVCNWGQSLPYFNTAGAIIHAVGTHFLNCNTAALFGPYSYNLDYATTPTAAYDAYFTSCVFEINDDYRGHNLSYPFINHVQITGVQGVKFEGCQFYNRDHNSQNKGRGYGVYCYDGGARFQPHCTSITNPCTSWQRCVFNGFGTGIRAAGSLNEWYTVWVDGADFDSCTIGIKTDHFNNVTTTHSSFKIGDGVPDELFSGDCHQNVGIWASFSEVFGIEDNKFSGYAYTGQPSDMQNIGVIVEHSVLPSAENAPFLPRTSFHNEVYRDSFVSLTKACLSLGPNTVSSHQLNTNIIGNGLMFKCNTYVSNDSAIIVSGAANEGIADPQGTLDTSAGNTFFNSSGHGNWLRNAAQGFWYRYYGLNAEEEPHSLSQPLYIAISTSAHENTCADHYSSLPLDATTKALHKARWFELKSARDSLNTVYTSLIDCGNTTGLRAYIDTISHDSVLAVRNALLNCSPYLSAEVVADAASLDILSKTQILHILFANPDLLHDPILINYLTNDISTPLSESDVNWLADSVSNVTERSALESAIGAVNTEMGQIGNLLLTDMKADTTYSDIDSIPVWLYHVEADWGDYDVAGYYYGRNQIDSGLAVIGRMPVKYGFDSLMTAALNDSTGSVGASLNWGQLEGILDYMGYSWIYGILSDVSKSGRSIDSLTESEVDTLNVLVSMDESFEFKAGKAAGSLLTRSQEWSYPCIKYVAGPGHKQGHSSTSSNTNQLTKIVNAYSEAAHTEQQGKEERKHAGKSNSLNVYPNPANEYVVFEYNAPSAQGALRLVISDTRGVKVRQFELGNVTGQVRWETRNINPGIYFYQMMDDKQVIKTGKVTVMR